MSYSEYINPIKYFLQENPEPIVLEIGIETGIVTDLVVKYLDDKYDRFTYYGIDIYIRDSIYKLLYNYKQKINLIEKSSLDALPELIAKGFRFDLLLVDGDHNYHTVSNELKLINNLITDYSIIIIDDYIGPYDTNDHWYSEAPAYANNTLATPKVKTEKQDVKTAVNDWLLDNPDMMLFSLINRDGKQTLDIFNPEHEQVCHGVLIANKNLENYIKSFNL
jgi:predicted O-methyltransferase YrrM